MKAPKKPSKPPMLALAGRRLGELAAKMAWPDPGPPPVPLALERALSKHDRRTEPKRQGQTS
jgi:hypothetical protein